MFFGALNQSVNSLNSGQVMPNLQHQPESLNSQFQYGIQSNMDGRLSGINAMP